MLADCFQNLLQIGKATAVKVYKVTLLQLTKLGLASGPFFLLVREAA